MSGAAILNFLGVSTSEPQRQTKPSVVRDRVATAEEDFARSCFANAMACAEVSHAAHRVCKQTAEVKNAVRGYTDMRETQACPLPNLDICRTCEVKGSPECMFHDAEKVA